MHYATHIAHNAIPIYTQAMANTNAVYLFGPPTERMLKSATLKQLQLTPAALAHKLEIEPSTVGRWRVYIPVVYHGAIRELMR